MINDYDFDYDYEYNYDRLHLYSIFPAPLQRLKAFYKALSFTRSYTNG